MDEKSLFILQLFYSDAKASRRDIEAVKTEIESIVGREYRVIGMGINVSAIAFRTDVAPKLLFERFGRIDTPTFWLSLLKVESIVGGRFTADTWTWIGRNRS